MEPGWMGSGRRRARRVLGVLELLLVLDPGIEVAAPGEDLRQCSAALSACRKLNGARCEGHPRPGRRGSTSPPPSTRPATRVCSPLDGMVTSTRPGFRRWAQPGGPAGPTGSPAPCRGLPLLHAPRTPPDQRPSRGPRDAGRNGGPGPPRQAGQLQRRRIRGRRRIARDGVGQEQQHPLAELPGGNRLVSG